MNSQQTLKECPICMDDITPNSNLVVTECGHTFHCSCLMRNAAINGFGCPCCRNVMAEEPEDSESDSIYDSDNEEELFEDNSLTSFRMFWQQIQNLEVEEEPVEEDDDYETVVDEEPQGPDAAFITAKLIERGITIEELIKSILYNDTDIPAYETEEYRYAHNQVFGKIMAAISRYRPNANTNPSVTNIQISRDETEENKNLLQLKNNLILETPLVAESKSVLLVKTNRMLEAL